MFILEGKEIYVYTEDVYLLTYLKNHFVLYF